MTKKLEPLLSMHQTWLRTNRRVLLMGMILPAAVAAVGLAVATYLPWEGATWVRALGWLLAGVGLVLLALVAVQLSVPRLAYRDSDLLVYLRSGSPVHVPIQFVECFFLASGTGQIPGPAGQDVALRNLVIRIAEKATDFHQREVKAALGRWEAGYVTIYGAWCERLDLELVRRLNDQLADAHATKIAASR